jgi:SpoVK/Ycf46/Vps4 family AAA+-type ATPase
MSINPELEVLIRDARFWFSHREWYKDRGIPWRRGYMLYGRPGTGKTSLVRALAEELDMPVFCFDLQSMGNREFIESWENARQHSPRIVLLEDIDAVFHGRDNISDAGSGLTFDALLNVVDGIEREDGLMLFITTNQIDKVDSALGIPGPDGVSTRPGRIDMTLEVPGLDLPGRLKMARRIIQDEEIAQRMAHQYPDYTAAQFQELCMKEALQILWGDKYKEMANAG